MVTLRFRIQAIYYSSNSKTRKDWEVFTTSGTYPWSFVTQIFQNGQAHQVNVSSPPVFSGTRVT
jgi:hypothetical protein